MPRIEMTEEELEQVVLRDNAAAEKFLTAEEEDFEIGWLECQYELRQFEMDRGC